MSLHPRCVTHCAWASYPWTGKLQTSPKCSRKEINHSFQIIVKFHYLTLLSIVSRLCERCMPQKLLPDIVHLLSDLQHGYLDGRSCFTQLLSVLHELGASLDAGKEIDDICLDFSKAFPIANSFINWLCLVFTAPCTHSS